MKKRVCTIMGAVCLFALAQTADAKVKKAILTEPNWVSTSNSQSVLATSTANSQFMLANPATSNSPATVNSPDGFTSTESHHGGGGGGGNSFSAGLQLQYNSYFSGGPHPLGIGLVGELGTEKFAYRFTFVYDFGISNTYTYQDEAVDENPASPNYGSSVPVTETDKYTTSIMNFALDVKKVFGDYSDGGFYVFAGIELEMASESASQSYSSYDASTYTLYGSGGNSSSSSFSQWYIRLGLGYDLKLGNGKLFGELGIDLAANQENGQTVDVVIPSFLHIAAGYRISFGR